MAKLKIVRTDGSVLEGEITPAVEYAFEQYAKKGFHKAFRDEEIGRNELFIYLLKPIYELFILHLQSFIFNLSF